MIGKILIIYRNVGWPNTKMISKVAIITKTSEFFGSTQIFYILGNSMSGLISVTNKELAQLNCNGQCVVNNDIPKLILL